MRKIIYLQKIGELDQAILVKLRKDLKWTFKNFIESVEILQDNIPLSDDEYNKMRRQYNASLIMKKMVTRIHKKSYYRTLGILDKDIYSGILNFVFGIAIKPNNITSESTGVALISVTRLRQSFYRWPEDKALFELRVLKEAIHELGHTFGLEHCDHDCIMRFSNRISDTDEKPPNFCEECALILKKYKD